MRDVIVIGLGAMGSAAALHLARAGADVLALDRFGPGHGRGSSHGATRVIRRVYAEGEIYMPLLGRAYALWAAMERDSGQTFLNACGGLDIGPEDGAMVRTALKTAEDHAIPHETLDAAAIMARFPALRIPKGMAGVFAPQSGQVFSGAANAWMRETAEAAGAELRWNEAVTGWRRSGKSLSVATARGETRCRKLVIAAGPWTGLLLPSLDPHLAVERQVTGWFAPPPRRARDFANMPVFQADPPGGERFYFLPPAGGMGVKAGLYGHLGERGTAMRRGRMPDEADAALLRRGLRKWLPGADGPPQKLQQCRFTRTADDRFIIGLWPDDPDVAVLSPCSGHGYKFAPAIGEAAAGLVLERDPAVDLAPFSVERVLGG